MRFNYNIIMKKHRKSSGTFNFKVTIVGNRNTGKTCFIARFVKDVFDEYYIPTYGVSDSKKEIPYGDYSVAFTLVI